MAELILRPLGSRAQDLTGKTFSRWIVLQFAGYFRRQSAWKCRCQCGTAAIIVGVTLTNGTSRSCGCLGAELARRNFTTHGMARTRLYWVWHGMKARCTNEKHKDYHSYGGRGIGFDPKWKSFQAFYDDVGFQWKPGLQIERQNVNGHYEKSNVTWIPASEQANNTRRNVWFVVNGDRKNMAQWCRHFGVGRKMVEHRIRRGWPVERLFIPSTH